MSLGSRRAAFVGVLGLVLSSSCTPTIASPATPSSTQSPPLASPSPTSPPQHRIGVRVVDGVGEFYDRSTGETFTPRGSNYVRLAQQLSPSRESILYHSTFNVGLYDPARAEQALARMHDDGYNVVRVFLNPCCRVGSIGDPAGGLSDEYVANVADFLERARANGVFVLITTDDEPKVGGYIEILDSSWSQDFGAPNSSYLRAGGILAARQFWHDFIEAIFDQGAPLDAVFAYELRNELSFRSDLPPLSLTSGSVTTANGRSYDMSSDDDRQRMMDEGLVHWIDAIRDEITSLDPTALVTVGFIPPDEPNPWPIAPITIRTYPALWQSSLDFVDLHPYPGGYSLAPLVENFEMEGLTTMPVIMGEFGAARSSYPAASEAARVLHDWQVSSCEFGFDGWLVWTWDSDEQSGFHNALGDGSLINQALAPVGRPDPCAPAATIQLTLDTPSGGAPTIDGRALGASGSPLAGAPVVYEVVPLEGPGIPTEYVVSGTVPPGATRAGVGFRVNTECGCSGDADFSLYSASYIEGEEALNRVPNPHFSGGLNGWGYWGEGDASLRASDHGGGWMLRVTASPGEVAAVNSTDFAVDPGAAYTLTILARVAPVSEGSGYFHVVFLGPAGEVARDLIPLRAGLVASGSVATEADGSFRIALADLPAGRMRVVARMTVLSLGFPVQEQIEFVGE